MGRLALALCATLLALPGATGCTPRETPRPRGAILIVLDTLRADRTSVYGAERRTTPALERLAADGVVFEEAVTNATWTLPAMAALMAGRYVDEQVFDETLRTSLVERLRSHGFRTVGLTEGGFVSRHFGFHLGFGVFRQQARMELRPDGTAHDLDEETAGAAVALTFERARRWLENNTDASFFMLIHTYEVHTPYVRDAYLAGVDRDDLPARFTIEDSVEARVGVTPFDAKRIAWIRALYDGGVAEADRYVGELLDHLEALGIADEVLVAVTSDHGEDLGGRDPSAPGNHGHALYDEQALVPLIIRDRTRDWPVRRVSAQVRTIDVMPTILDRLGVPLEGEGGGRSLVPLMAGESDAPRPAWMRVVRAGALGETALFGLRTGDRKLVVDEASGPSEAADVTLFDLASDPGERHDVAALRPDERRAMLERYQDWRSRIEARGAPDFRFGPHMLGEQTERLRALGYIE